MTSLTEYVRTVSGPFDGSIQSPYGKNLHYSVIFPTVRFHSYSVDLYGISLFDFGGPYLSVYCDHALNDQLRHELRTPHPPILSYGTIWHQNRAFIEVHPYGCNNLPAASASVRSSFLFHSCKINRTYSECLDYFQAIASSAFLFRALLSSRCHQKSIERR